MLVYCLINQMQTCMYTHHVPAGVGKVTNSYPDNNTVIAHFEGEEGSCILSCEVKNDDTQTDTVWSIENYKGRGEHQPVPDGVFEISGDWRNLADLNYGNHLNINNCSSRELNGTVIYCGSHENPKQSRFEFKVCGML